ncbi:MAG: UdgX family uracil-DNA binding protein, partial [Brevundimonas sp.]|uniref:UdgX family uracil-DNA binding protein n=1 Tax=Brevundimonas sp. TaxID=1871086 RepID=UPI00272833D3
SFTPGVPKSEAPSEDRLEETWLTYYANIFNPARLKTKAMQAEMPKKYWKNLPEAAVIHELTAQSFARTETMVAAPASEPNIRLAKTLSRINRDHAFDEGFVPSTLDELGQAVQACRRCPLWRDATQGVCGAGAKAAPLMIVGEQPGDHEDLAGRPFVEPAGQVLDEALAEAGIRREDAFVTNAVRHFKHEPRGKRRIHKTPLDSEISACRWWLDAERRLVKPKVIVTLGATAALGVLNRKIAVTRERGKAMLQPDGARVMATVHPAWLLRLPDEAARIAERGRFIDDLKRVRAMF